MKLVRLLLHVEEETISLSNEFNNQAPLNHKVISVKKINFDQKDEKRANQVNPEETKQFVQMEIDALEQELKSLERKKQSMIEEMSAYISREKEAWEITKEEEKALAKEEGLKKGFDQGTVEAIEKYDGLLQEANKIVENAEKDYYKTVEKHQITVLQLAVQVAKKILQGEISEDPNTFLHLVENAIEQLIDTSNVAIYLHPNDHAFLHGRKEELEQLLDDDEILSLYIDQDLNEGDCLIKHPFGQIDASVDTQLTQRSEEHTSELQSRFDLVCRLLLEK